MKQLYLQTGCKHLRDAGFNISNVSTSSDLLSYIIRCGTATNDSSIYLNIIDPKDRGKTGEETDAGAVMYIVAVLVFYSAGIIVMIIKYLRREKRELEEERILEDFFRSMPAYKKEREQNNVNRVAIHAFHALTSFSYDDVEDDVYSSEEEEGANLCAETIHEEEAEHHDTTLDMPLFSDSLNKSLEELDLAYSRDSETQLTDFLEDVGHKTPQSPQTEQPEFETHL